MNALHANFLVGKLFKSLFNSLNRTVNIRFDNDVERFDFALGNMAEQILQADLGQVFKLLRFDSVAAFLRNLFGNLRNVHDIAC